MLQEVCSHAPEAISGRLLHIAESASNLDEAEPHVGVTTDHRVAFTYEASVRGDAKTSMLAKLVLNEYYHGDQEDA